MKSRRYLNAAILILVFLCLVVFHRGQVQAEEMAAEKAKPIDWDKDISISAVGDLLITNKVSFFKDSRFTQLVDILRNADCTYGNCETTFFKPEDGFPAYKDMDPNVFCYPWGADEIKRLGIDLVSLANNHIMDFAFEGMFATIHHLERVGIDYAGAGRDLNLAARPGYFESEAGRVSLVSFSSWLPEKNHQASLPSHYMKGKPGLNPLNMDTELQLDPELFAMIKKFRDSLLKKMGIPEPEPKDGKEITTLQMMDNKYVKGDKIEISISPNKKDLERIEESIKIAKRNSRIVIVSQHEHMGSYPESKPMKAQEEFARSCIDAGADMYVCTGPHQLWGIEIYKGKPIFYSIGNFFFQGPLRIIAPEAYQRMDLPMDTKDPTVYEEKFDSYFTQVPIWDSIVPVVTFDNMNKVKEISLYPIYLDGKKPIFVRGTPRLAEPEKAGAILKQLSKLSEPYKTKISFIKGVAKIVL